jgi:NitT/TauT family transport system substrate-binding protein
LPLQVAFHKGYYKDEGIDLEIVLMPTNIINTAALTGQIDINGAVTGTVGAAVQGSPMKLLIVTVGKPLLFLVSRKDIKDPRELRGKKIAGSSPGGTATVLAKQALSHYGIDPEKDAVPMGGSTASRFAAMESGVVDATMLPVPAVIFAKARGITNSFSWGTSPSFRKTALARRRKNSRASGRNLSTGQSFAARSGIYVRAEKSRRSCPNRHETP